jgi:hypothetical protein
MSLSFARYSSPAPVTHAFTTIYALTLFVTLNRHSLSTVVRRSALVCSASTRSASIVDCRSLSLAVVQSSPSSLPAPCSAPYRPFPFLASSLVNILTTINIFTLVNILTIYIPN